jgi:cytochrome c5
MLHRSMRSPRAAPFLPQTRKTPCRDPCLRWKGAGPFGHRLERVRSAAVARLHRFWDNPRFDGRGRTTQAGWIVRNYDLEFLKKFSLVIGFLAAVTLGLILFAHHLNGSVRHAPDPAAKQRVLDRISPAGAVYAGATGAAAQAEALKASAAAAAAQVAYGGTTDGKTIFGNLCTGCHTSGAGGAPTLDAAGIGARAAAQGIDTLVQRAIEGFTGSAGVMPAKGGNPALTDEQVKAAVEWMVGQSQ